MAIRNISMIESDIISIKFPGNFGKSVKVNKES